MMVLLSVATLGLIVFGYFVMCRLDSFIERGGFAGDTLGRANYGALVYGSPKAVASIQKAGIVCRQLEMPTFPDDGPYSAFFVLSQDDCENLALCYSAKRADSGIYVVARCNTPVLYRAFEAAKADRILASEEQVDALFADFGGVGR